MALAGEFKMALDIYKFERAFGKLTVDWKWNFLAAVAALLCKDAREIAARRTCFAVKRRFQAQMTVRISGKESVT